MTSIFQICQGVINRIINTVGVGGPPTATLPQEIVDAVENAGFLDSIPLWAVTLLGGLFITMLYQ